MNISGGDSYKTKKIKVTLMVESYNYRSRLGNIIYSRTGFNPDSPHNSPNNPADYKVSEGNQWTIVVQ